jgi:uncharacterized repeat protein (TIGR01451 family)
MTFVLTLLMAAPAWAQAELTVEKTGDPSRVVAGEEVTYTVVVTNTGDAAALLTELTDNLPGQVTFVSVETDTGTCTGSTAANPEVTCELGTLDPDESATVTITGRASRSGTNVENEACANTDPALPGGAVCDSAFTTIVPRLAIDKIDDRDPVTVGGNILYTLRVTNEGGGTVSAGDAVVIDELPIGEVRLVSVDSNLFECDPLDPPTGRIRCTSSDNLEPGDIASIKITVDPDEAGTIENTATVSASGVRIDTDTETTRVTDSGGNGGGGTDGGGGGNGGGTGGGNGGGGTGGTGGSGTGGTGNGTTDGGGLIVDTTGDGVLIVSADDEQYKDKVIAATIPDKALPNTGGMPLLGLAALALASVVTGASVLRAGTRRRG